MLAFVSGRGGVGKTAIVATSALVAASWGMRVAVVDLDLAFGNLFGVLGMSGPADLSPLSGAAPGAAQAEAIVRCGRKVCERVALWGPCEHAELAETVQPHAATLLSVLSSRYDLVLVDTSTTWGDAIAQAVQTCDRLVIVGDQRAGAVSSLARAGNLAVRLGVARTRIMRLMNRCDPRHRDEGFLARADVGLECARNLRVVDGGDEVAELLSAGLAQELSVLECDFTDSLSTALAQMLSELGCLPDDPRAARALEGRRRLSRGLFGRGREAS
jgi:pilus assembly protein CpaE